MAEPVRHYGKWRIRWFDVDGVRRSEVYPTREEASFALKQHEVEAEEVRRGIRERRPAPRKFGALCDYWLATRTARKRSPKDDRSIIRGHLRPAFGELMLTQIGVAQVEAFMVSRAHLSAKTVHNRAGHADILQDSRRVFAPKCGRLIPGPWLHAFRHYARQLSAGSRERSRVPICS